jgi:small subunit ribosomal protein S19
MPRSIWKGPFLEPHLLKKLQRTVPSGESKKRDQRKAWTSWSRRSVIIPQALGLRINLYNGKNFVPVLLSEDMIGHKLGEFVPTRVRTLHKGKTK